MSNPQERINASTITPGVVIAVERRGDYLVTTRKRRDVLHATVTGKDTVAAENGRQCRYAITTDLGAVEPCPGVQTFPLISRPTVPAGAPDASAVVVAGTVVAMVERVDLVAAPAAACTDPYSHRPGTIGCAITVSDCNGIPTGIAGHVTERPIVWPARTGADEIGAEIAGHLRYRFTVGDVTSGYTDTGRTRGVREVSTWSTVADGHTVTALRYTGRETDLSTLKDYVSVLVDGVPAGTAKTVEPADIARVARDHIMDLPAVEPAAIVPAVDTVDLGSALSGLIDGDDVPAVTPCGDQVAAPAPHPATQTGSVRVRVTNAAGDVVRSWTRPTWNQGIRSSEDEVRSIARAERVKYHGAPPSRTGEPGMVTDTYRRVWTSSFGELTAVVTRPAPAVTPTQEQATQTETETKLEPFDAYEAERFEHYLARGEDHGTATEWAVRDAAKRRYKATPGVTVEERPSGTPVVAPSADAPYAPTSERYTVAVDRPDVPAGMPYVIDAPEDWAGPVVQLEAKQVAAMLRGKAGFLAAWFPGGKFSVRTDGGSIDVSWSGGPAADLVDLVAKMWQGKDRDSQAECDRYRGTVLHVAPNGTQTAYRLPGVYVFTSRKRDTASADLYAARQFLPDTDGREFTYGEFVDPYGREWFGGSADECARWMAERGVTMWTRDVRAAGGDPRPVCPVNQCADAAGHPWPGMHRNDYGRAFLATLPDSDGDQGDGGNGGTPTDVDPVGPAPSGGAHGFFDQGGRWIPQGSPARDDAPTFRTWEELADHIGDGRPVLDPSVYAVTPPDGEGVDVVTWSVPVNAATASYTCPAHGAVPVPANIDGSLARTIVQEHQACAAGDPFGMAAIERESTPAAQMARTLRAAGWSPEEVDRVNDVRPLYMVTNNGHGRVRVHAVMCQDIARDVRRDGVTVGDSWEVRADHVRDVVIDLYDDATAENWREFLDLEVMPCADLDESDDAPAFAVRPGQLVTVLGWSGASVFVTSVDDDQAIGIESGGSCARVALRMVTAVEDLTPEAVAATARGYLDEREQPDDVRPGLEALAASGGEEIHPAVTVRPWVTAHVADVPTAQLDDATESAETLAGEVRVSALVGGERVHLVGVDQFGSPTHYTGYVNGAPGPVTVKGRTASGRVSRDPKKSRRGLLVSMSENPGGWNGSRMTVVTTLDAYAEHVTDSAHQFRPGPASLPHLVTVACSCKGFEYAGETTFRAGRNAWLHHANEADAVAVDTRTVVTGDQVEPVGDADDDGAGAIYTAPEEWYVPAVDSDKGGEIVIMHDHEDGTVLLGSSRGDGVYEIAKSNGFDWRRSVGIFIPRSRDQFAQLTRIRKTAEELRTAGHTVTVLIDDVWRPAAVREEARGARVTARVERLTARSLKQSATGDARRESARKLIDAMPFGEPIKIGHHSETAHRRAFERIESGQRAAFAAYDYARHLAGRADGAASNEDAKHGPRAIMRRIERLEADHREAQRRVDEATMARAAGSVRYWWLTLERLAEDIAYQRAKLGTLAESGEFVAWGPSHFVKGDHVRIGRDWFEVVRANRKTISARGVYGLNQYADKVGYDRVYGRRRDGVQLDTPNGKPRDIDQAKRVERWETLMRAYRCASYTRSPEEDRKRLSVGRAIRVTLGLPRTATAQEVAAFGEPTGEEEQHARALAMLTAFERFQSGEAYDQVAADTTPLGDTAPAWTMPEGEPERVRARDLVVGDIVCGIYDNFAGQGERLVTSMVGPVTAPAVITDRRESGEWYALEVDGELFEGKTFRRVGAYLVGAR